jgi:cytochrome c oxidase subunit II
LSSGYDKGARMPPVPLVPLLPPIPPDASVHGHHVDTIFGYLTITTGACVVIMTGFLLVPVVLHRDRGRKREAHYTHGVSWRDKLLAALVGAVVLVGIDLVALVRSADALRTTFWSYPDGDPQAVRVEVLAQQWSWTFRHPGRDGTFNTADDLVILNELVVPTGRPIYLQLRAKDVVHSFYLPNFRTKVDVVPAAVTRLWFQPRHAGSFEIGCAQHCGAFHYKMRGTLRVLEAGDFARWMDRATADALLRHDPADREAHDGWDWQPAGSGGVEDGRR